jgi:hypothetical protein
MANAFHDLQWVNLKLARLQGGYGVARRPLDLIADMIDKNPNRPWSCGKMSFGHKGLFCILAHAVYNFLP